MSRRIAYTDISYKLVEEWLKNPIRHHDVIWQTNLPKDALIWRISDGGDPNEPLNKREVVRIYWESHSFGETQEGAKFPEFPITATTTLVWAK